MLDLRQTLENLDSVRSQLEKRSKEAALSIEPLTHLDVKRRELIGWVELKAAERNRASDLMAKADKSSVEFSTRREELKKLSSEIKEGEKQLSEIETEMNFHLVRIPNIPHPSVPLGSSSDDNVVERIWGEQPKYSFEPQAHWDLGTALGILDFERAAKLSGSRFTVLFRAAAKMERSLISFMLDLHTEVHGYQEVLPPFLVKETALFGTGQLPKMGEDMFKTIKNDPDKAYDLYLIPTAEVPVTNLHADEILEMGQLPIAYTAYTPCFRSEAGSHGKDVRGLIRQHQFDKVELVRFCSEDSSEKELELLTSHAEEVLKRLKLHYRVVSLCAGDISFASQKTYDLEVWLPSQNTFREISSCSNFGDFQARRAQIRYRPEPKAKPKYVHTLNGSALAVGRTLVAILEQYQQSDGSIVVPEVLRERMGCEVIRK